MLRTTLTKTVHAHSRGRKNVAWRVLRGTQSGPVTVSRTMPDQLAGSLIWQQVDGLQTSSGHFFRDNAAAEPALRSSSQASMRRAPHVRDPNPQNDAGRNAILRAWRQVGPSSSTRPFCKVRRTSPHHCERGRTQLSRPGAQQVLCEIGATKHLRQPRAMQVCEEPELCQQPATIGQNPHGQCGPPMQRH